MGARTPEKSPERCAIGGSSACPPKDPATCRPDSQLKKKNVLSLPLYNPGSQTGPPRLAPNWLRSSRGGLAPGTCGWNPLSAVSASLRLNSHAAPCNRLVPLLVVRFTCPPGAPPTSAEYVLL